MDQQKTAGRKRVTFKTWDTIEKKYTVSGPKRPSYENKPNSASLRLCLHAEMPGTNINALESTQQSLSA